MDGRSKGEAPLISGALLNCSGPGGVDGVRGTSRGNTTSAGTLCSDIDGSTMHATTQTMTDGKDSNRWGFLFQNGDSDRVNGSHHHASSPISPKVPSVFPSLSELLGLHRSKFMLQAVNMLSELASRRQPPWRQRPQSLGRAIANRQIPLLKMSFREARSSALLQRQTRPWTERWNNWRSERSARPTGAGPRRTCRGADRDKALTCVWLDKILDPNRGVPGTSCPRPVNQPLEANERIN
jgi:hypothetical protein